MQRIPALLCSLVILLALVARLDAVPFDQAHVTRIINDVRLVQPAGKEEAAKLNDVVSGDTGLRTGIKSRSELLFQDNTLTRIGPESYFSFRAGTRDITLEKGTLLLQVPKSHGGAKIHTAAVTASITGTTIMIEHQPKQTLKVLVLEGSLRLSVNGPFGDSLVLRPGKMVIMKPDAKRIPDPVSVDLKKVMQTSKLVNMKHDKKSKEPSLPSVALVEKEIARQDQERGSKQLVDTNLVILGKGTDVVLASQQLLHNLTVPAIAKGLVSLPVPPPSTGVPDVGPTPTIKEHDNEDGTGRIEERYGEEHRLQTPLVINNPQDFTAHGGTASVKILSDSSVTVNSMIKVSDPTSKQNNGEIVIDSRQKTGTAISITSSAQLLALMGAVDSHGGKITFRSAGGNIDVNGQVDAGNGAVDMRNSGESGVVNVANATLHGDVIKVGALGNNGTLNVGGGTMSADSVIRLYAGGSNGTVNFTDNVTLSGNSVKTIAGDTVTIFDGKVVTILGPAPANVFTNHPNYTGFGGNGSTTGTFGGQGATTQPLNQAPGF